ncbi:MAG: hypothetical protein KAH68_09090, partial [Draconibacterium sp.]|nr:hypothetical protein [Draconibacterium sp.]
FLIWQCNSPQNKQKPEPFYIYDSEGVLKVHDFKDFLTDEHLDSTIIRYIFEKSIKIPRCVDTFLVSTNYKRYFLEHYLKYGDCVDTSFTKHKSHLSQIKYFDNKWLENEAELDSFWMPIRCWHCAGIYDTAKIFLILPIENTDSVIIRQVHRFYNQTQ